MTAIKIYGQSVVLSQQNEIPGSTRNIMVLYEKTIVLINKLNKEILNECLLRLKDYLINIIIKDMKCEGFPPKTPSYTTNCKLMTIIK